MNGLEQISVNDEPLEPKWAGLAGLAILSMGVLWFCQDLLLRGEVPFFRDLGTYFYPLRLSVAESFRAGELPLWDRRLGQGFPLLAAFQPGVFYPPHILLAIVPFFSGISLLFVIHFLIAGIGAYQLIRNWRYPCFLATIGALMFSLGGTMISLTNLLNHFQSAVWLPWVILTWERLLYAPTWRKFLIFTFILTMQFLAGSPEVFAMSMVLVVVDGLRTYAEQRRPSPACIFGLLAGATLLLIAISSVQIFPTAELFLQSRRQQSMPTTEAVSWSLNPINLLNLFFLERESELGSANGMRYFLIDRSPFFITYYMGSIFLFGMIFYFHHASWRERLIASGLVLGLMILALGSWTPIYPFLLRHMTALSAFRYPEKFFFLIYAILIFLTMKGLRQIFDRDGMHAKPTFIVIGCICLLSMGVYAAALLGDHLVADLIAAQNGVSSSPATNANATASLLTNLERHVLLTLVIALLIYLAKAKTVGPLLVKILLTAVVFVDLVSVHKSFLFSVDPKAIVGSYDEHVRPLPANERTFYYPSPRNLHPSFISGSGSPDYRTSVALWFRNLMPNAGIFYGAEYMQEIDALGRQPYTAFLSFANRIEPEFQVRLLRAFNVGHVIAFRELSIPGLTPLKRYSEYFSWHYRVKEPVPRAYVVNKSSVELDVKHTLERLAESGFDPLAEVILDRDIPVQPSPSFEGKSQIVHYANTRVTIETETNDHGILVFLDSHYPGWKAFVDGKETAIARANHFYRAVAVPAGKHSVEFRYEPQSFKIGAIISSVTLFSILVISLCLLIRRRQIGTPPQLLASGLH